jgi:hypothetical protein
MHRLEFLEQCQRMCIVRPRSRLAIQARYGFDIVVHDIRWTGSKNAQCQILAAAKIGYQDFDACRRRMGTDRFQAGHEMTGAAIAQIIAINRGNDDIRQSQCTDRVGEVSRLIGIEWVRPAMPNVAKRASARALVAHDHEGRGALAKTFADIGAACFFADGHQVRVLQD